jgi:hypothetical protein
MTSGATLAPTAKIRLCICIDLDYIHRARIEAVRGRGA